MGTQVAIAEQIVEGKGDFMLALKANQDTLVQQVMNYVDEHISDDFAGVPSERLDEETKKGHGRLDSRIYIFNFKSQILSQEHLA